MKSPVNSKRVGEDESSRLNHDFEAAPAPQTKLHAVCTQPRQTLREWVVSRGRAGVLALAVLLGQVNAAAFEAYIIRNATSAPNNPPTIQFNSVYVSGATEFVIAAGGQKAGFGSAAIDGNVLGKLGSISIVRHDDRTRFAAGSGPAVAPYINFWITDGNGNFAVVANEPSDAAFQPLYTNGYNLTWADLANKVAKVYENSNLSWLPATGSSGLPAQPGRQNPLSANMYTFADLAGYIIQAPTAAQLSSGWPGLGSGAPRELGTNRAWGVNWIFGDTLTSYVSGAEGYVVSAPAVSGPTPTVASFVIRPSDVPVGNVVGVSGDAAPGFLDGSFASNGVAKTDIYFRPEDLFGRAVLLGEVKRMTYWTKKGTTHVANTSDWYLALYTKPFAGATPNWYGSRFGSEPYFSENLNDPAGQWNQWSTGAGDNWLRFFESTAGAPGANFGAYTDPHFYSFLNGVSLGTQMLRRNQDVLSFSIQTGSGWANGFTGQLDGYRIELANGSVSTVNFEPDDTEPPVAHYTTVNPSAVAVTNTAANIVVTASIDDTLTGGSNIVSAEFSVAAGAWMAMTATDLSFNSAAEGVTGSFTLANAGITQPGVYTILVRGTDAEGLVSNEDSALLAVYDPNAGFVTGGGWINSPALAYAADPGLTGKANFGFVSKYKKGATVPEGSTEFVFQAGGLNFHSSAYEWLVVNQNGTNAQFKGTGRINGAGNYGFMIWASDNGNGGATDTFRIQIVDKDNGDATVYDNGVQQTLGGGNIMIQTKK